MNPDQPVLNDIILPAGVSWWPPAPVWWYLALLAVVLLAGWLYYKGSTARTQKTTRKQLFDYIQQQIKNLQQQSNHQDSLHTINRLLKLLLVNLGQREHIASLHQQQWVDYLEQQAKPFHFSEHSRFLLGEGLYQPQTQLNLAPLLKELQSFLQQLDKNIRTSGGKHV